MDQFTRQLAAAQELRSAYKGYLICNNPFVGAWWVEKDGFAIEWARDVDDAKRIVNALVQA